MSVDRFFRGYNGRLAALTAVFIVGLALLAAKLWYEQVYASGQHRQGIRRQSIRRIRLAPSRGRIVAADGAVLADNVPRHDVCLYLHEMRRAGRYRRQRTINHILRQCQQIGAIIGRPSRVTDAEIDRHLRVYPALPFRPFRDLDIVELGRLHEHLPAIPGLSIEVCFDRRYPLGDAGAHLLGFVGRRDPQSEPDRNDYWYFLPELAGRAGLEAAFDAELRGRGGARMVRVDHAGLFHERLEEVPSEPGADLLLTIDSRAQATAQRLLAGQRAALVLLDCNSGAVLALASAPSYDLNDVGRIYGDLALNEAQRPLINRALAAGYMPGSILKPLIALAALDDGAVTPQDTIGCGGYYRLGDRHIGCTAAHGPLDVRGALQHSCNTYFITVAMETGVDRLSLLLASAGIGLPTGLELDGLNDAGVLPSRDVMWDRLGRSWIASDTAYLGIGQGFIGVSPLQAALYTAALANGGRVYRPHLVRAVRDRDGRLRRVTRPHMLSELATTPESLQIVREGMWQVVHGAGGATGSRADTPVIELAGKTGTAEVGPHRDRRKNTWFVCFGPWEDPRYAMAVLVEDGISGGRSAAPIARRFFEEYLGTRQQAAR